MENYTERPNNTEEVQLMPLIKLCWGQLTGHWPWFALSLLLCAACGWLYQQRQPRIYQRQAVMLIENSDPSQSGTTMRRAARNSNMTNLLELNGVSVGDNLKNEEFILSSQRLMRRVVEKLQLDIDYTARNNLHPVTLYGNARPFMIIFTQKHKGKRGRSFRVRKGAGNTVTLTGLTDREGNELPDLSLQLGQTAQTPLGPLCIVRGEAYGRWPAETDITVTRVSQEQAAKRFLHEISVSEYDKESSLIVLTCNDMSTQRADDILQALYNAYKEDVVENKNRVALNTARFIDGRIGLIGQELSQVENRLAGFKRRNNLVDFDKSPQVMLTQSADAHQLSLEVETQLNVANYLAEYLSKHSNDHDLIPALSIGDASFNTQIAAFNELMNQRNLMVSNSSEQQSMVREADRQLAQMRQSIRGSLASYTQSLEVRLRDAKANEALLNGRMAGVPEQEKQGLDIQRQQSLKEALYTYLLNKREEVALQQAINEANVRLVEGPIGGDAPVSPRRNVILLLSLLTGLLIPAAWLWIRFKLDVTVKGRRDIEDATTIPLLGEVPRLKKDDGKSLLSEMEADNPFLEAFRILRFNLDYLRHDKQVMMLTSSTPGQGKTFVSKNLAIILSMAGKHVLLIDADIRKRTLSGQLKRKPGLTTFLADDHLQAAELIVTDGLTSGVDLLPAGIIPPNPTELLMSGRLKQLIDELRSRYDYIIIDSTPLFAVADAGIVGSVADTTLFVVRAGMQDRDLLPELERMYQNHRFNNLCIVLNDTDEKQNSYGYGYGYGNSQPRHKRAERILRRFRH